MPSHTEKSVAKLLHQPKYFDFAAATPLHPLVLEEMMPYFWDKFQNPSALYEGARLIKTDLDDARASVARSIGVRPSEIVFTAGGSESIALAIHGVMAGKGTDKFSLIISSIEHDAVRKNAELYICDEVGVDEKGIVILKELKKLIESSDTCKLVSIILASNEVGTVQPIPEISHYLKEHNKKRRKEGLEDILLHIDASQAPLYMDCNPVRLGVDLMTLNGGKMYGPKQSGILYIKTGVELTPYIKGGGQEFGLRSGTENVAFAVGFAKALSLAVKNREERAENTSATRDYLIDLIENMGATIAGHKKKRIASNVLAIFDGVDNERLLIELDILGFSVASGSACHASRGEPSHVLHALGLSDKDAHSAIRFSINEYTTKKDCDELVNALQKSIAK